MSEKQDGINVQWILTEFCKYSRPIRSYDYMNISINHLQNTIVFMECKSRHIRYCIYLFKMNNPYIWNIHGNFIAMWRYICLLRWSMRKCTMQATLRYCALKETCTGEEFGVLFMISTGSTVANKKYKVVRSQVYIKLTS